MAISQKLSFMSGKDIRNDVQNYPLTFGIAKDVELFDVIITKEQKELLRVLSTFDAHDTLYRIRDAIKLISTDLSVDIDENIKTTISTLYIIAETLEPLGFENERNRQNAIEKIQNNN